MHGRGVEPRQTKARTVNLDFSMIALERTIKKKKKISAKLEGNRLF